MHRREVAAADMALGSMPRMLHLTLVAHRPRVALHVESWGRGDHWLCGRTSLSIVMDSTGFKGFRCHDA